VTQALSACCCCTTLPPTETWSNDCLCIPSHFDFKIAREQATPNNVFIIDTYSSDSHLLCNGLRVAWASGKRPVVKAPLLINSLAPWRHWPTTRNIAISFLEGACSKSQEKETANARRSATSLGYVTKKAEEEWQMILLLFG